MEWKTEKLSLPNRSVDTYLCVLQTWTCGMLQIFLRVAEETGVDVDPEENPRQAGTPPSQGPSQAPQGGAAEDLETGAHTHTHKKKNMPFHFLKHFHSQTSLCVLVCAVPCPSPPCLSLTVSL